MGFGGQKRGGHEAVSLGVVVTNLGGVSCVVSPPLLTSQRANSHRYPHFLKGGRMQNDLQPLIQDSA